MFFQPVHRAVRDLLGRILRGERDTSVSGYPRRFHNVNHGLVCSFGIGTNDNGRFMQNVVRWLLNDGQPDLQVVPTAHHALGTFFFNNYLEIIRGEDRHTSQQTVAYVERVLRRTGVLKALDRPGWLT